MAEFVDTTQIHVRAGDGGAGAVSFRREAHVDKGGPDGGDGGDGGSVLLIAGGQASSLIAFKDHPFRRAEDGLHGQGKKRSGRRGADLRVVVPVGTVVKELGGEVVADLAEVGAGVILARGGRGGMGNARFLSNRRRAPAFAEQGEPGEERWLNLELKLAADVALVGEPNVGKSSLIAAISRARPKIGDYPFTTLVPNLGVVKVDDREYVVADVPGLIEGAAEGKGLGHSFLRHVERARILGLVVELPLGVDGMVESAVAILGELGGYLGGLESRETVLIGNKRDLVAGFDPEEALFEVGRQIGLPVAGAVSAIGRSGTRELALWLGERVDAMRADALPIIEETVVHHPLPRYEVLVERVGQGRFSVDGRDAIRAVGFSDINSMEALAIVQGRLKRMGVFKMLKRLGVREGDTVVVSSFEFTFTEE